MYRSACLINAAYSCPEISESGISKEDVFSATSRISVTIAAVLNMSPAFLHNNTEHSFSPDVAIASVDLYILSFLKRVFCDKTNLIDAEKACIKDFVKLECAELLLSMELVVKSISSDKDVKRRGDISITAVSNISPLKVFGSDSQRAYQELMSAVIESKYESDYVAAISARFGCVLMQVFEKLKNVFKDMLFLNDLSEADRSKLLNGGDAMGLVTKSIYGCIRSEIDTVNCGDATEDVKYLLTASLWAGFNNIQTFAAEMCNDYVIAKTRELFKPVVSEATAFCSITKGPFESILENIKMYYDSPREVPDYNFNVYTFIEDVIGAFMSKTDIFNGRRIKSIIDFSKLDMQAVPITDTIQALFSNENYEKIVQNKDGVDAEDFEAISSRMVKLLGIPEGVEDLFGISLSKDNTSKKPKCCDAAQDFEEKSDDEKSTKNTSKKRIFN